MELLCNDNLLFIFNFGYSEVQIIERENGTTVLLFPYYFQNNVLGFFFFYILQDYKSNTFCIIMKTMI